MGTCQLIPDHYDPSTSKCYPGLCNSMFYHDYTIGKGGFGRVWKVQFVRNSAFYAMKEMLKARVIAKRSIKAVLKERKLLAAIKHPFIVNMNYAFQDRFHLYLVMDLMTGGDLRYHIGRNATFSEEQTKFFAACVITGLEYLHVHQVIHRDIKPENLVLDSKGYLRITDFGAALVLGLENSQETSGTPGYMAPEVMCRKQHGSAVDYFALGVIIYEFMKGKRLFTGKGRKNIKEDVMTKAVELRKQDVPIGWSMEAADFVNKLLERKPENRLGFHGPKEVKAHAWFRGFPWQRLLEKKLPAPFTTVETDNFDTRFLGDWQDREQLETAEAALSNPDVQKLFSGYFYDPDQKSQATDETSMNSLNMMKTV